MRGEFGLSDSDLAVIRTVLKKHTQIQKALLFGSRAKGNQKISSDVDLALFGNNLSGVVPQILGELEDESPLPYRFDIVDFDSVSNLDLKSHILRVGKVLFETETSS